MNESERDLALQESIAQRKRKTIQKERGKGEGERETEREREGEKRREKIKSNVIKEMYCQEGAHTGSTCAGSTYAGSTYAGSTFAVHGQTLILKGFWGGFSTGLSQGGYARSPHPTPLFQWVLYSKNCFLFITKPCTVGVEWDRWLNGWMNGGRNE